MSFNSRCYVSKMPSIIVDHDTTPLVARAQVYASAPSYAELRYESQRVAAEYNHNNYNTTDRRRTLVCYLPSSQEGGGDDELCARTISCVTNKCCGKIVFTTDINAAIVPAGAIIDSIEYFGYDTFTTKGDFSIGLGQLNSDISFPLIQDTTSTIANERVGGCRDFISCALDGKNSKNIVLANSHVNVELSSAVTNGGLQIIVYYHMKML
jgi:hypothetical protein